MKGKPVTKWLLRVASKEANPYVQAELLYQALGDGKPYSSLRDVKRHFKVFNNE